MCIQYTFNVYQYICYLAYANLLTYSLTHSFSYPKSRDAIAFKKFCTKWFIQSAIPCPSSLGCASHSFFLRTDTHLDTHTFGHTYTWTHTHLDTRTLLWTLSKTDIWLLGSPFHNAQAYFVIPSIFVIFHYLMIFG